MNEVFFTADEHYNHAKIVKIMNRPFSSIEEMNETLIQNHNRMVKPGDRVYHLGDFAWFDGQSILQRLNGEHYLIRGNHDYREASFKGFIWIRDTKQLTIKDDMFWLSHYPHMHWPRSHYGSFHLYGHTHGMVRHPARALDVGVDNWDYYPINSETIVSLLKDKLLSNHHPEENI